MVIQTQHERIFTLKTCDSVRHWFDNQQLYFLLIYALFSHRKCPATHVPSLGRFTEQLPTCERVRERWARVCDSDSRTTASSETCLTHWPLSERLQINRTGQISIFKAQIERICKHTHALILVCSSSSDSSDEESAVKTNTPLIRAQWGLEGECKVQLLLLCSIIFS